MCLLQATQLVKAMVVVFCNPCSEARQQETCQTKAKPWGLFLSVLAVLLGSRFDRVCMNPMTY